MRWVSVVVAVCLVGAACSDDGSPAPESTIDARSGAATTSSSTTTLRPPPPTDPPEPEASMIGDLEIPCRATSSPVTVPERPGVTSDAITIGTGSDRGGIATPDSGKGAIEMVQVLADHCNAEGGLLGRDVRVEEYDAAAVEVDDRVAEACAETTALVGQVFLQSIEAEFAAAECGLVSLPAGDDLVPTNPVGLHGHLAAAFAGPENGAGVVLVGPDTVAGAFARATRQAAIEQTGGPLTVAGTVAYPIAELPDWGQIVGVARATGAGQVHLVGGCAHAVLPFADTAAAAGWAPIIVTNAAAYDEACLDIATPENLLVELPFLPFEDGAAAPATAAHAALLERVGAPLTGNGILAASAFWRWVTAEATCLADDDPTCLATVAAEQDGWTAGGLHQSVNGDGTSEGCAVVLAIEEGAFVRRLPSEPGTYDCTPEWSVAVP